MAELAHGNPSENPSFWRRLMSATGVSAPVQDVLEPGEIRCQLLPFEAAGEASSTSAILEVRGRLDRRVYRSITLEADQMRSRGVRRFGLLVDSGGGGVTGLDDAVAALLGLREAIGAENYTAYAVNAASAGYGLLATAGKGRIFAGQFSPVGSLGTVLRVEGTSRLFRDGLLVDPEEITSGKPLKIAGNPGLELTDDQRESLQARVNDSDLAFIRLLALARGDSIEAVQRMAGQGAVYEAPTALSNGLIDGILTESEWRSSVSQPTTEVNMSRTAADADNASETTAGAAQADSASAATVSPEPAAPAPEAGSPPPAAAAPSADVAALLEAVQAQSTQINALRSELDAERQARADGQREATIAGYRRRINARIGNPLTRTAADAAIAAVEATVNAGQDAEALVASFEALPPIDAQADLGEEITFTPPGATEAVSLDVDYRDYGVTVGANGQTVVNREGAVETAAVLNGATGRDAIRLLEAAHRQDGGW